MMISDTINDENSKNMYQNNCAEYIQYNPGSVTSLHVTDFMERHVDILYMMELTISSNQEPVILSTNAQHNFQRGLLPTMKKRK